LLVQADFVASLKILLRYLSRIFKETRPKDRSESLSEEVSRNNLRLLGRGYSSSGRKAP
jgi:hypothetical protein